MFNKAEQRRKHLNGELTHDAYYLEYANAIGYNDIFSAVKKLKLVTANGFAELKEWDKLATTIRPLVHEAFNNGQVSSMTVSLAEIVCLGKVVAENEFKSIWILKQINKDRYMKKSKLLDCEIIDFPGEAERFLTEKDAIEFLYTTTFYDKGWKAIKL